MVKKKPKNDSFEIRNGRDARSGRSSSTIVERIPKAGSINYATAHNEPPTGVTRTTHPKTARPIQTEVDVRKFVQETLVTDSVIMEILAK